MTTLSDNYNTARQQTWESRTGGLIESDGTGLVLGAGHGGSNMEHLELTGSLSTDNQSIKESFKYHETTGFIFAYVAVVGRGAAPGTDSYYVGGLTNDGGAAFIRKVVAGTPTDDPAPGTSTAWVDNTWHTIELRITGTTTTHLSLLVDDVEVRAMDDSSSPLFGSSYRKVGHAGWYNSGSDWLWTFDDFLATDYSATPNPNNLTVTPSGSTAALAWDASAGAIDYSIFRRTPQTGAAFNPLSDTPLASGVAGLSYNDNSVPSGNYDYQVFGRLT